MSDSDEEFEKALEQCLQRVDAPAGLLQKVMDETEPGSRRGRLLEFLWRRAWIGAAAASLALVAVLVGGVEHRHRAEERTRADRDFARSTEITDRVMEQTRQRIQRAGIALDD